MAAPPTYRPEVALSRWPEAGSIRRRSPCFARINWLDHITSSHYGSEIIPRGHVLGVEEKAVQLSAGHRHVSIRGGHMTRGGRQGMIGTWFTLFMLFFRP